MSELKRAKIFITGTIQGVGFRPFIYNLANQLNITGWVNNNTNGVQIEAEGSSKQLQTFLELIPLKKPPLSEIENIDHSFDIPKNYKLFSIRESDTSASNDSIALALPDTATCDLCLNETLDSTNKRYLYPFTTCTLCGPRYSISEELPFDRARTSMKIFQMCPSCQAEYENPADRRFHSQTNSCPDCGPELSFLDGQGYEICKGRYALDEACEEIKKGSIVAIKGIGGFHLFADAGSETTLKRLRKKKNRKCKPFALMMPNLQEVEKYCTVNLAEKEILLSPLSPVVLLQQKLDLREDSEGGLQRFSQEVAPGLALLGVMLPYTPLHHLITEKLKFPLVATSANISDEPICSDELMDLSILSQLADFVLTHNRPIRNSVDDAIVRIIDDQPVVFRIGRGNSPGSFNQLQSVANNAVTLAAGGHLKNTIALSRGNKIYLSQHNGSLDTLKAIQNFQNQCTKVPAYFRSEPTVIVHDKHPHYASSLYAADFTNDRKLPLCSVQHHQAHILSCVAEHNLSFPLLGVCWDGTGYGLDGTIWGGEFLLMQSASDFERLACIRPFQLPGGDRAILEPRRSALGILHNLYHEVGNINPFTEIPTLKSEVTQNNQSGDIFFSHYISKWLKNNFTESDFLNLTKMLKGKINSPQCSSAGRLFDAIASLLNICHIGNYEGEAAMKLEALAFQWLQESGFSSQNLSGLSSLADFQIEKSMLEKIITKQKSILDQTAPENKKTTPSYWVNSKEIVDLVLQDLERGDRPSYIAFHFHYLLAKTIEKVAKISTAQTIVLTGGVFQNKLLSELALSFLRTAGLEPYINKKVPPNDGGLSVGQAYFVTQSNPGK